MNEYLEYKKLSNLNMREVVFNYGDNSSASFNGIKGEYLERNIYTVGYGFAGKERIYSRLSNRPETEKSKWPKRTLLSRDYKSTGCTAPRFTPVGHSFKEIQSLKQFIITGGIADGITIYNALGCPGDIGVLAIVGEKLAPILVRQLKHVIPGAKVTVALDNDKKSKTGHRVAIECETDWVIPETIGDWNDIYISSGIDEVSLQLANTRPKMPNFDMWQMKPYAGEYDDQRLSKILYSAGPDEPELIAQLMISLSMKRQNKVFSRYVDAKLMADSITDLNLFISPKTKESLLARITMIADSVYKKAKEQINISAEAKARHNTLNFSRAIDAIETVEDFEHGLCVISGPHACGKTTLLAVPFYKAAVDQNEYVSLLAHLRTLVSDLSTKFGAMHYDEAKKDIKSLGISNVIDSDKYSKLAICLPSIALKLKPLVDRTGVLIIDEISQVVRMVVGNLDGMINTTIFESLTSLIRNAKRVLVLDADVDDITIEYLEYCRPGEKFTIVDIPNPTKRQSGLTVDAFYGDGYRDHIYNAAHMFLDDGKRIMIATDGRESAACFYNLLCDSFPEKNFLLVNADTTTSSKSNASLFMNNADVEAAKYDAIVHSPSIRSGLSITKVHFDEALALMSGNAILPQDCIQQMRRPRMVKHWTIGIAETKSTHLDNKELLEQQQKVLSHESSQRYGVNVFKHDIDTLKNNVDTKEGQGKNAFGQNIFVMLALYGFKVSALDTSKIAPYDSLSEYIKDAQQDLKDATIDAPFVFIDEYVTLCNVENKTTEQKAKILAFDICESCGIETVTEEWFQAYKNGITGKAWRLKNALQPFTINEEHSKSASLHKYKTARALETKLILDILGYQHGKPLELTTKDAQMIVDHIWGRKERLIFLKMISPNNSIKHYKNKTVEKKKPKEPRRFVQSALEKVGIMLSGNRGKHKNGERERGLITNSEQQKMVNHIIGNMDKN